MRHLPIRLLIALIAVLALPTGALAAHHPDHDEERCEGTDVDPQTESCGALYVRLVNAPDGAENPGLTEVLDRNDLAWNEAIRTHDPRTFTMDVPVGREAEYRDTLNADPAVETARFAELGEASDETTLPNTAMAPIGFSVPASLGMALVALAVLWSATRRTLGRR